MKIQPSKAIEILDINVKEAGKKMPPDCMAAILLSLDALAGIVAERAIYGYTRIGQLPHEEPLPTKSGEGRTNGLTGDLRD